MGFNARPAATATAAATAPTSGSASGGFNTNTNALGDGTHRMFIKSSRLFFLLLLRFGGPIVLITSFLASTYAYEFIALTSLRWEGSYLHEGFMRLSLAQRMLTSVQYAALGGSPAGLVASDVASYYAVDFASTRSLIIDAVGRYSCSPGGATSSDFNPSAATSLWCVGAPSAAYAQAEQLTTGNTIVLFADPVTSWQVSGGMLAPGELTIGSIPGFTRVDTSAAQAGSTTSSSGSTASITAATAAASGGVVTTGASQSYRIFRLPAHLARVEASKRLFLQYGCVADDTRQCATFSGGLMGNGLVSGLQAYATSTRDLATMLNTTAPAFSLPAAATATGSPGLSFSSAYRNASMNCSAGVASSLGRAWDISVPCSVWNGKAGLQLSMLARSLLPDGLHRAVQLHADLVVTVSEDFLSTNLGLCITAAAGCLLFYLFAYLPALTAINTDLKRTLRMLLMLPAELVHSTPALRHLLASFTKQLEANARSAMGTGAAAAAASATALASHHHTHSGSHHGSGGGGGGGGVGGAGGGSSGGAGGPA